MNLGPIDLLVVQPTPFCNIDCTYCYLPERHLTKKISLETVVKISQRIKQANLLGEELTIVWHAGEPLVIKPAYFKELVECFNNELANTNVRLKHSIQTNGILITQEWCDLINEFDINIGISLDGPSFLNDKNRVDRKGKGTLAKTMKGIDLLIKNNIPYHAIAVLTADSIEHPNEIFSFFKEAGFYHVGFNVEEIEGDHTTSSFESGVSMHQLESFYQTILELFNDSDKSMTIRELSKATTSILRQPQFDRIEDLAIHSHQTDPYGILAIDCDGGFSTFSPELIGQKNAKYDNFIFGNVHEDSLESVVNNKVFSQIKEEIESGIEKCRETCDYFHVCGGGAPSNKLYENGDFNSTETLYCKYSIQVPLNVMLDYLEEQVK